MGGLSDYSPGLQKSSYATVHTGLLNFFSNGMNDIAQNGKLTKDNEGKIAYDNTIVACLLLPCCICLEELKVTTKYYRDEKRLPKTDSNTRTLN